MEILNAAPMVIDQGTQDLSMRQVPLAALDIPQHLPLMYLFAAKGPVGRTYVDFDSVSLTQIFGDDTFDVNKKYYTHTTPFLQAAAAAGNNVVVHRLIAPDASDVANVALYLDYLPTQVPMYVKNTDGSIALDVDGNPVVALDSSNNPITTTGYKVCYVLDHVSVPVGTYQRGTLTVRPGIQVDGATQSEQIPLFEFACNSQGEDGNKLAIRMYPAMKTDVAPFPSAMLGSGKMYPYYFGMVKIADQLTGKTSPVLNRFGAQHSNFVVKGKGVDPTSGAIVDLNKVTKDNYIDVNVAQDTGLGVAYVYQENLDTVLQLFYDAEKNVSDEHRDSQINNSENNIHAFNVLTFTSSNGSPYQSVRLVDVPGSTRITRNTNLFMKGSSDGSISEELLDALVAADLENYNNSLHEYNDQVMHPESILYDSGFSIATKRVFPKMISRRKDTFVVLSTYAHDAPAMMLEQHYSVGVALKTMLELYPESATFGTGVMRGLVFGGSGEIINSLYAKRVPTSYELIYKAARYMGAKNGAWRNGFLFDRAPGSVITQLKNIDVTWVPASTRNTLWSVGINFVLNYKTRQQFFPALQTVYENDTSVLNSFFTAVAISYLNKVEHAAWREFSGVMSLSPAQLEERVNDFVAAQVKDKFDNLFIIIPDCKVTEMDAIRGYSWTLNVKIGAENSRTVQTTMTTAYRKADLEG